MKLAFYLVFVLGVVFCEDNNVKNNYNRIDEYEYVDNPDNYDEIVRPCQVYDLNCIRRFFAEHSNCSIRNGPIPGEFVRSQFSDYLPRVNFTLTATEAVVAGLNNSRIEEFYINKATNKVVIAIEGRDLSSSSRLTYFNFYRRGREPITPLTTTIILYKSITITAVIPNINNMQFDKAEITPFLSDAVPPFYLGPEVASDPDPTIIQAVAQVLKDVPTSVQEQLLTESPFYAILYIQTNICDFGLKFS